MFPDPQRAAAEKIGMLIENATKDPPQRLVTQEEGGSDCVTRRTASTGYIPLLTLAHEHGLRSFGTTCTPGGRSVRWDTTSGALQEIGPMYWGREGQLGSRLPVNLTSGSDGFLDHPPVVLLREGGRGAAARRRLLVAVHGADAESDQRVQDQRGRWHEEGRPVKDFLDQKLPDGTPVADPGALPRDIRAGRSQR